MISYTHLTDSEEFYSFNENDLTKYEYIALFRFAKEAVDPFEFAAMRMSLADFMKKSCLIILKSDLDKVPNDVWLKHLFSQFTPPSDKTDLPYLAIAAHKHSSNKSRYLKPYFHYLPNPDTADELEILEHLNAGLESISSGIHYQALEEFKLVEKGPRRKHLVVPNGIMISQLKDGRVISSVLDRSTWVSAEQSKPVDKATIEHIAKALENKDPNSLILTKIPIKRGAFSELREKTHYPKEVLAEKFNIPSTFFFEFLEGATWVPNQIYRYMFHRYEGLLSEEKITGNDLIDFSKIE